MYMSSLAPLLSTPLCNLFLIPVQNEHILAKILLKNIVFRQKIFLFLKTSQNLFKMNSLTNIFGLRLKNTVLFLIELQSSL